MAGSNQAQNLYGLLSGLTGAFNQEDMGQGMMFAQNIRDYNAPVLDANDPNSVLDRQRWAQRNGYQNEAVALGATLGQLNKQQQTQDDKAEYNRMLSAISQLETQRQKALQGLTVPGGGPPSPQQVSEVNANFDRARDKLAFRIDEYAAKVEGASGTAGAEAVSDNEKARRIENILTNNGLGDYTEMAPYMEYSDVQELLKNKNKLGGKTKTGTIKRYANGAISTAYDDGTASVLTPGGGIVLSDASPEEYEAALSEAIESGPEMDAAAYWTQRQLDLRYDAQDTLRQTMPVAINDRQNLETILDGTSKTLEQFESGNISTHPITGLAARFGWADEKTGKLQADAIYNTLLNLQITKLTPVTEKEIAMVAKLWADPSQITSANIGALKAAMQRINDGLSNLDANVQFMLDQAAFYNPGDPAVTFYRDKWDRRNDEGDAAGSPGGEGTENLDPDSKDDADINSEVDELINKYSSVRRRGPQGG